MADQQALNQLLKWGVENSTTSNGVSHDGQQPNTNGTASSDPSRGLNPDMLAQLLGGPSDADLMRQSMSAIVAPIDQVSLEDKMVAWDNLEQLIEQIDNANNMESMGLWPPLVQQLEHQESEMRRMAAWCCSTAVQNNIKAQENLLAHGAIPKLAKLAQEDSVQAVRKKAISALSSEVRNFQPGMDDLARVLDNARNVDAADMEDVSRLIDGLRERPGKQILTYSIFRILEILASKTFRSLASHKKAPSSHRPLTMSSNAPKRNIVIIGGGIIGCSSAYFLSRHPSYDPAKHSITLLEASKIAGGASGKAGGLLALWAYPSSIVPLSYRLHKQLADEHGGVERWGYRAVHCAQVDCVGREVAGGGQSNGTGEKTTEGVSLQKRTKEAIGKLRAAGVPAELDWVAPEALRAYDEMGDPSTTAQVHPFLFTTAMAELAAEKGVDVKTQAPVQRINYDPSGAAVESVTYSQNGEEKTLPATDIVIAAGPWTRNVYPTAPISALRAHSVTIRPSREISAYALFTQIRLPSSKGKRGGGQIVSPEIYARPNNEAYACGEGDHVVPLPATSEDVETDESRCQEIIDQVSTISDELRDGEVLVKQACYLPNVNASGSGGPLIGLTGIKGEVMAAGHTCWGIQNGPGTGKIVSEFVFDGDAKSAKVKGLDPRIVL
nr:putative oxidoreductase c1f5.03c [Quercus suber]